MAIKVIWGDPQQSTIRLQLGCDWTWDEFDTACEQAMRMCESVQHEVSVEMDIHTSITLTPQILWQMHSQHQTHQTIEQKAQLTAVKQEIKANIPYKFASLLRIPS
jgi:hypothetical protein